MADAINPGAGTGAAEFLLLRANAIQNYAKLEQSLFMLFATLADVQNDIGGIIFFKITNTHTRNSILERLIRKKHGSTYNLFWNSYIKQLHSIDSKRNEIVHWNVATNTHFDGNGNYTVTVSLAPPNFWDRDANTPSIAASDLREFIEKCDVFSRLATMFTFMERLPAEPQKPWLDIFQQPLVYPLPTGHLLTQQNPPQSSPP
jgi:hypothetical protein